MKHNFKRLAAGGLYAALLCSAATPSWAEKTPLPECESGKTELGNIRGYYDAYAVTIGLIKTKTLTELIHFPKTVRQYHMQFKNKDGSLTPLKKMTKLETDDNFLKILSLKYKKIYSHAIKGHRQGYTLDFLFPDALDVENDKIRKNHSDDSYTINGEPSGDRLKVKLHHNKKQMIEKTLKTSAFSIFLLSDEQADTILSQTGTLGITFWLDDKLVSGRVYENFHGRVAKKLIEDLSPSYYAQEKRKKNKECVVRAAGCFLTTAACDTVGLPDDCWELETLRDFRDGYLSAQENGAALIEAYYQSAPKIVEAISKRRDAEHVFLSMYWRFIMPSAVMAKLKLNKLAHSTYVKGMQKYASLYT